MKKFTVVLLFPILALSIAANAEITFSIDKSQLRFRTDSTEGTFEATRGGGASFTMGAIVGIDFRLIATDSITGRKKGINDFAVVSPPRLQLPTNTQIRNLIKDRAFDAGHKIRFQNYFIGIASASQIVLENVDGLVDVDADLIIE